jgi:hypothetical protein
LATLVPYLQQFVDLRDGSIIGIHKLKLLSASDTFTVPNLANTSSSASSDQIRDTSEASVTVSDNGTRTITLTGGVAGNTCTIVSHHRFVNNGLEA